MGYYVAQAKGFYGARHLDVTILQGGPGSPATDQVLNGSATFAISSFDEQKQLVRPPAHRGRHERLPDPAAGHLRAGRLRHQHAADLAGRRVGVTTDYWKAVPQKTLRAARVAPRRSPRWR